jgi:Glycosyl hydrolase family 26
MMPGPSRRTTVLALALAAPAACAPPAPQVGPASGAVQVAGSPYSPQPPYDISPLLRPKRKYLGLALDGSPRDSGPVRDFTEKAGKQPNIHEYYVKWGDRFLGANNLTVWNSGQLPFLVWEPFATTAAQIAAGRDDPYIRAFAAAVRDYNRPLALSFGHEMNGGWYPWGSGHTKAADFAHAWRHIHDLFTDEGAANAIWVWSPNVINPMPDVRLRPYYPGDSYVDWVGVVGYYARSGPSSFRTLFGPTMAEIRGFTGRPFIIAETASQAGPRKPADIADLFHNVATHHDVLGLVWFNLKKEADWRIDSGPASLAAFRRAAAAASFGFDVRKP